MEAQHLGFALNNQVGGGDRRAGAADQADAVAVVAVGVDVVVDGEGLGGHASAPYLRPRPQ